MTAEFIPVPEITAKTGLRLEEQVGSLQLCFCYGSF
jgi:hypothetical protein